MPRQFPPETVARLKEAANGERTIAELAALIGRSTSATAHWLLKLDLPRRAPGNRTYAIGAQHCGVCGTALDVSTDAIGRTVVRCVGCARRKAGRCMDCAALVEGRRWRCARCKPVADTAHWKRYAARHRKELCEKQKRRNRRETAAHRANRLAVKKAWRERNWKRVKLVYRKRQRERGCGGFATREAYLAYHKAYRAARKAERAA